MVTKLKTTRKPKAPPPTTARDLIGRVGGVYIKIGLALAFLAVCYDFKTGRGTPERYFLRLQDAPVLAATALIFLVLIFAPLDRLPKWDFERWLNRRLVWIAALGVVVVGAIGTFAIFANFPMSLDEFMANFDAKIFASGRLMAETPAQWRDYVFALQPSFALETPGNRYWASSYLPVNAMLRAATGWAHVGFLLNPVLSGIAVVVTYAVGRQLWPERPRMAVAAALILAMSSQLLVTGMTAYAMPAHLAFNMVWLWLFLRNRPVSDAGAIGLGFAAAGLHQVLFHPLFVGPFVLELWLARKWRRAAVFTAAYAAIGVFWILYWSLLYRVVGIRPDEASAVGGGWFMQRIMDQLDKVELGNFALFDLNLIRFITWQNLLVAPLTVIGGLTVIRRPGHFRAMALGIWALMVIMLIILPSQTHGWGYRYLHGFLGSSALLSVFAWVELQNGLAADQRRLANSAFALLSVISLVVLFPLRAWEARVFTMPYARSYAAIRARPEQVVLIDNAVLWFDSGSEVRNDPFLTSGPKVMLMGILNVKQLDELCSRGKVWVFDGYNPAAKGMISVNTDWGVQLAYLRDHLRQIGCAN